MPKTTPQTRPRETSARPDVARTEAWNEYLAEVRTTDPARYDEVEPWAWCRLQAKLRMIREQAA
jgi:hypothetical protein